MSGERSVDLVEEVAVAWIRWARAPGSEPAARAKEALLHELAGPLATELHDHIASVSREAADPFTHVRSAITEWLDTQETRVA